MYDERMCAHANPWDFSHPEKPERIVAIAKRLKSAGVFDRCIRVEAREARDDELATVHTKKHISLMRRISSKVYGKEGREKLARHYNSIYFNNGSSESALLAAGSVVELCVAVAKGDLEAGAAIVRPPGHHAEADAAMGFCLFNNVAVAAHVLVHEQDLGIRKVLIVDWDVHHGNGTQNMFWDDNQVLYFSIHRYDNGSFYPMGMEGNFDKIGSGSAAGFNVNVPWPHGGFGDSDYLAVWDYVLLPIAKEFNPDIVLISGGFDSAEGDPLGGCRLTPFGYSEMTRKLMDISKGRVVLVLEGGYNLKSIAESYLSCLQILLGDPPFHKDSLFPKTKPLLSTWTLLHKVREVLQKFWPVLNELSSSFQKEVDEATLVPIEEALALINLSDGESVEDLLDAGTDFPKKEDEIIPLEVGVSGASQDCHGISEEAELVERLIVQVATLATNMQSKSETFRHRTGTEENVEIYGHDLTTEALKREGESMESGQVSQMTFEESIRMAELISVDRENELVSRRINEEKTYVWYASYGSNMWNDRFMCYLQGGQVEGMKRKFLGSRHKVSPSATSWMQVGNQMFFGHSYTSTWGHGGVAFLEAKPTDGVSTHVRLYKITVDQFNDLFMQENSILDYGNDLIEASFVHTLCQQPSSSVPVTLIKDSWYGTVLHLGEKDGIPILTFTCSEQDVERFKAGLLPLRPPSEAYQGAVARGLMEDLGLSKEEALSYVSSKVRSEPVRPTRHR